MKKRILMLCLFFFIACEINFGDGDERDRNTGGGCEIRL